jgi:hypothetical protein
MFDGGGRERSPRLVPRLAPESRVSELQHVITAWLLRAFSRPVRGAHVLQVYDKELGTFDEVTAEEFLAEVDAHSSDVERGFQRIEGPAANAAQTLRKRTKSLPPGMFSMWDNPDGEPDAPDEEDVGEYRGMALRVFGKYIAPATPADRIALAKFAGLMYRRAPALEAASPPPSEWSMRPLRKPNSIGETCLCERTCLARWTSVDVASPGTPRRSASDYSPRAGGWLGRIVTARSSLPTRQSGRHRPSASMTTLGTRSSPPRQRS